MLFKPQGLFGFAHGSVSKTQEVDFRNLILLYIIKIFQDLKFFKKQFSYVTLDSLS